MRLVFALVAAALGALAGAANADDYALQRQRCGLEAKPRLPDPQMLEACTAVIDARKETPQDLARAYVNRGDAWRLRERAIDRAIADYDEAIRLRPDFALAFAGRGFTYLFERRNPDRAIQDFDEAIRLDSTSAVVFYYRATAYADKGALDRAIADFDQAIRLKPDFSNAYRDRGQAKQAKGDLVGAAADLARAESTGSRTPACDRGTGCGR
ncbi:MAG: tetratricopeptide repeat protein [Alphaproteobacteria bacterium]|nr:tetratricopeptide repeat protein [Alphaproteobacteria bacterium]MBV8408391.1 tetratricopeptide repeat protein [Alphaproteobacteria bacterium]